MEKTNDGTIPDDIRARIEGLLLEAKKQLTKKGKVTPAIIVLGDETVVVDPDVNSQQEKVQIGFMVRELVKLHKASLVVQIAEIWALPDDMPLDRMKELLLKYRHVSACPQRIEKVYIRIERADGGEWTCLAPIYRSGRSVSVGKAEMLNTTGTGRAGHYQGYFAPAVPMPTAEEFVVMVDKPLH
jgi:hypothetical protein